MFVIRIEAVVIKVDGDDVREGQLLDPRLRVQRAMKDERNQRKRFSETQGGIRNFVFGSVSFLTVSPSPQAGR